MAITPTRPYGIYITMGVALVGALVAGIVLYTSSKATGVNLTTAQLVPEDAGIYFALNTDLSSNQWIAAFDLARRMGTDDPEEELHESAEASDIDWEDDVAPFLGGNAAVYLKGFDIESFGVSGAIILEAADPDRALEIILEKASDFDEDTYEGVTIYVDDFASLYTTRLGDHIVLAMDQASLEEVVDVSNGTVRALADIDGFRRLRDELTNNFLGFVYLNTEGIAGDFALDDAEIRDAIREAGLGDLVFQPAAGVIGAKTDGFEFQAAAMGDPGVISPVSEPRKSRFVTMVPADTAIFVSTAGISEVWERITTEAGDEIDKAIREEGTYGSLDEALEAAGREIGLESIEELITLFSGETVLAGWYTGNNEEDDLFVLLAEVEDEAAARDVVERIIASGPSSAREEEIGGAKVLMFEDEDGDPVAITVHNGFLALGDVDAIREVLEPTGPVLSERDIYLDAVGQMPTKLGSYAYLDMARILRLAEGGVPAELDEVERVMEALILNLVNENEVVRLSGILTVADE